MQIAFKIDKYHLILIVMVVFSLLYNITLRNMQESSIALSFDLFKDSTQESDDISDSSVSGDIEDDTDLQAASDIDNNGRIYVDGFNNIVTFIYGDTLFKALKDLGVSPNASFLIAKSVNKVFKLSTIKAGEKVEIMAYTNAMAPAYMSKSPSAIAMIFQDKKVIAKRKSAQEYTAEITALPTIIEKRIISGSVQNTFLSTAKKSGLSNTLASDFVRIFSYDIDFQRDIEAGTEFKVLYDSHVNEKGKKVKDGKIIYAALQVKDKVIEIYRHDFTDGTAGYFYKNGTSIKKALLKTPVKSAIISSGYGMRKHPVLGYSKVHRGLDYAAPTGTPVLAAGDGVIESVKNHNTYGKYVKIKHGQKYATLYAHLQKFSQNSKAGTKVKQGDIIGYVGATGLATGPHLHYEVHVDGKQVNPAKVSIMQSANSLDAKQLVAFKAQQRNIEKMLNDPAYFVSSGQVSSSKS